MRLVRWSVTIVLLAGFLLSPVGQAWASAEADYLKARERLNAFKQNPSQHKYRDKWMSLIDAFNTIQERYPTHARACDALYNVGVLYREMSEVSYLSSDRRASAEHFERLAARCGSSSLADDGLYWAATIHIRLGDSAKARILLKRLVKDYPNGDMAPSGRVLLEQLGDTPDPPEPTPAPIVQAPHDTSNQIRPAPSTSPAAPVTESRGEVLIAPADGPSDLTAFAIESASTETRLNLSFSRLPAMTSGEVAASGDLPRRLYFDFVNTRLASSVDKTTFDVADSRVRRIRVGQFGPSVVRVVFELNADAGTFGLANQLAPAIAVIAIKNRGGAAPEVTTSPPPPLSQFTPEKSQPDTTARKEQPKEPPPSQPPSTEQRQTRAVVLDPGHGGEDTGAIGTRKTLEKEITLQISRRAKKLLEKQGITVILTRDRDATMGLFDRTKIANDSNADLFISIHCNANRSQKFSGVEVFYLNNSSDSYSSRLADRENKVQGKPVSDLDFILTDLSMNVNVGDSILLANMVQKSMVKQLRRKYPDVVDRGVKRAVFHVLLYARMPAVLVETSFLSNPTEEARLRTEAYQQQVAEGIASGILLYFDKVKMSAGLN